MFLIQDGDASHTAQATHHYFNDVPWWRARFTPAHASWLNQVERWFGIITQQAIRRGSFKSVRELKLRIEEFVAHYNRNSKPFQWVATADSILDKVAKIAKAISGTAH